MEKLTMIGHIKDTSRVLKKAYDLKKEYCDNIVETFKKHSFKKIFFTGSGTSYNASLVMRDMFVSILGVEGIACIPNIFAYHETINPNGVYNKDEILVMGLSQHGDSISTLEALKKAKAQGYYTIGITEELGSMITKITDQTLHLLCEREEIGPETRGYTETIFQMYILAVEIAAATGKISAQEYSRLSSDASYVINSLDIVVNESIEWYKRNREEFLQMTKCSISGYGSNYPTAVEARLKLFETFSRPCMFYEQEEQLHGPLRAYNGDNYIFMIGSEGKEIDRLNEVVPYYKDAFTSHVFVVTSEDKIPVSKKDLKLSAKTTDILSPVFYIIPFQVLSALICEDVGIDTRVSPVKKRYVSSHLR